jgi:putative transcriptional regulator
VAGAVLRARAGLNVPVRNTIREARLTRGLTQEQLAQACEVTRQTIIALEAGKYSPSLELAFRLARALGRDLEEIFRFEEIV